MGNASFRYGLCEMFLLALYSLWFCMVFAKLCFVVACCVNLSFVVACCVNFLKFWCLCFIPMIKWFVDDGHMIFLERGYEDWCSKRPFDHT